MVEGDDQSFPMRGDRVGAADLDERCGRGLRGALIETAMNPEAFRFWWSQIEAVFDVKDRVTCRHSPTRLVSEKRGVLDRFSSKAEELAGQRTPPGGSGRRSS